MTENVHDKDEAFANGIYAETFVVTRRPHDVFAALLDPAGLRVWFAEHVEIEPRIGGSYRFWGRYTPYMGPTEATQRITSLEPDVRLEFSWRWGGDTTHVDLRLAAHGKVTAITVRHDLGNSRIGRTKRESCWFANDFWGLAMGNLEHFLKNGVPALRPDLAERAAVAEVSIDIEAPVEDVWRSLTEPGELREWMGAVAPRIDLRVGGDYSYGWIIEGKPCGPVQILELEPLRRLVVSWQHEGDATNRTEWRLERRSPRRTRVTVLQSEVRSEREFLGYTNGWAKYLHVLKARREAGASS